MAPTIERFSTCSITDCLEPGVRGQSCSMCQRHLCKNHRGKLFHHCPSWAALSEEAWREEIDEEISSLLQTINVPELVAHASALNNGIPCTFQPGQYIGSGAIMGCANYHAWLLFNNNERWLVRIPRNRFSDVPSYLVEYLVASEYATLKFLESTCVPAPKVYGCALASKEENKAGVSYLFLEALPGTPYDADGLSPKQKSKVLSSLADILIELSKHPFPRAGSLIIQDDGELTVAEVASNRFVALGLYGPFTTTTEYYTSIITQYLDLIADGQLYPEYPVEAFLIYSFLQANVHQLASSVNPNEFYLKHVDDKGDHLLIDEQGNITGIIDWQFARCVPIQEAFGPSLVTANLNSLYSSTPAISEDDRLLAELLKGKNASNLAEYQGDSERARRFHLGLASGMTTGEAWDLIQGLLRVFGSTAPPCREDWVEDALKMFIDHQRFRNLISTRLVQ